METILKELEKELEKIPSIGRPEVRGIRIPLTDKKTDIKIEIYWNGNAINWEKMAYINEWGDDKIIITLCEKLEPLQMQVPFKISKEKGLAVLKNLLYGE